MPEEAEILKALQEFNETKEEIITEVAAPLEKVEKIEKAEVKVSQSIGDMVKEIKLENPVIDPIP